MAKSQSLANAQKQILATGSAPEPKTPEPKTIDSYLKMWATKTPDAPAFTDAPNRERFAIGKPQAYNFAESYRIVTSLAEQFTNHGLKPGDVLAIQLPNTVELPIVIIAALHAGLIPCPFPVLWRQQELNIALKMIPARAMVTVGKHTDFNHSQMMCDLAFDHLSIRFVYGIGPNQSDGVTSLNNFFTGKSAKQGAILQENKNIAQEIPALITWAPNTGAGLRPIFRTHRELIASGLMHVMGLDLSAQDRLLSPFPLTGLIGLAGMLMPSLMVGASLTQHNPFEYDAFIKQLATEKITYTAAPAPVLKALIKNNIFKFQGQLLTRFGCVWHAPRSENDSSTLKSNAPLPVYDIRNLNETALYISRRNNINEQGHIKLGEVRATTPSGENLRLLETRFRGRMNSDDTSNRKYQGTLYVRGATVPLGSGQPVKSNADVDPRQNWTNTGIQCSIDEKNSKMDRVVFDPDSNIIHHGGVVMYADELDNLYSGFVGFEDAAVVTSPDPILGERLWVAAKIVEILKPTLDDFKSYLKEQGVAPYKIPERLIVLDRIPRGEDGKVIRRT